MTLRGAALLACVVAAGCSLEPVELDGKACPCAEGWTCDAVTLTCVPGVRPDGSAVPGDGASADGARIDAAFDAAALDGSGSADATGPREDGALPGEDGAVPTDAGGDAGGAVDSGPAPATSCDALASRSDIVFCDGLEDASLSPWTARPDTGTVESTTVVVRRGSRAARTATTVAESGGRSDLRPPFWTGITSGDIYYRAWYYVPSTFDATNFGILVSSENASPYHGFMVHFRTGNQLTLYSEMSGVNLVSSGTAPRDDWFCLQVRVTVHPSAGSYEVWLDGVSVMEGTGLDTLPGAGFTGTAVGITYTTAAQDPAVVYVDEVAVARAPIPCE